VDDSKYILGAQGNVWAEYIDNMSKLEYSIFPRMAALSEVLWTPNANKNWKDFKRRIPSIFKRYESWGSSYSKAYFMLDAAVLQTANFDGVLWKVESKLKTPIHIELEGSDSTFIYQKPVYINKQIGAVASSYENKVYTIQDFNFNKATEKKITLTTPPSPQYPGSGAFTLLDGVQNMKGFARSTEFIGFEGKDCEAIIDLGKEQEIYLVTIHSLHQKGSWIWRPSTLKVSSSADAITYTSLGITDDFNQHSKQKGTMSVAFSPIKTRYLKVLINNWGEIPAGEEGAGHPAWLFVDEIEVE
jgi:hexosaminidase